MGSSGPGHSSPATFISRQVSIARSSLRIPLVASAMALSHPLNFSLDYVARLLILVLDGMNESSDYRKAYETAKRELSGLIANQERLEKRKVSLRKTIETLAALCESEGVEIEPSPEADYLRMHSTLSDEIRNVLKAHYPAALQPLQVKKELEALGHDLGKYSN